MKKILIGILFILCLVGCDKNENHDYKQELIEYNTNLKCYVLEAEMEIKKPEGEICFVIEAAYLSPNYYKVIMKNKANNNTQVMVKNDEGVFVITPSLNKEFKFNSDWPLNSSHAYLLQSIVKDITNDSNTTVTVNEDTYMLYSKVENKSNANLKEQKTTFDKKNHHPIQNIVYDNANNPLVTVKFTKFDDKASLTKTDFDSEVINNTCRLELGEGEVSLDIDSCVPTFMPEGFELNKTVADEEYKVYSYVSNNEAYIISCIITEEADLMTVSRTFNEAILLDSGFGFVNENSLSFYNANVFVSIYNDNFELVEAITIANSFNK